MQLIAAAVVLAGALIATAIAYTARERVVGMHHLYVVYDRWTGQHSVCVGDLGERRTERGQPVPEYACYDQE